ncbi:MAG: TerC/Alx family metal homeostasis membrane protein [Actinobacteria bacterium]|nr:TerC/Alx family metal homeostasis membrane protein [Actinomycetota bacterium]MCA1721208.1 TerC/Alx family metal homeostasis membrane protein [Actinomycetota bacterium]
MHLYTWIATLVGFVAILAIDLIGGHRSKKAVTTRAAAIGVAVYVAMALLFGLGLLVLAGSEPATQFVTGYVLEYSLSVDNLFVYLLLMASFAVPEQQRRDVLLVGIVGTLVLRAPFIIGGAAAAQRFSATFFVFGAVLLYTAVSLARAKEDTDDDPTDSIVVRLVRRVFPVSDEYDGSKLTVVQNGKRAVTPLLLAMVAVSVVGLVFALDSIPAIFGVTKDPYLIVAANAFALMGLRQLFFLVGGLLEKLVYLSLGLAVILGFIGVKLILEALHLNGVESAPEIGIAFSLGFIVVVLAITTVASLRKVKRDPAAAKTIPTVDA